MNKEFDTQTLSDHGIKTAKDIAELFNNTLDQLKEYCPNNREFAITKTKLEEACFFAKKSMSLTVAPE